MKVFFSALFFLISSVCLGQIVKPVKWAYAAKRISKTEAVVVFKATIDNGWHIYSQNVKDGPVATSFTFAQSKAYAPIGKTSEPKPITKFEKAFETEVSYFEKSVVFQQKIKLNAAQAVVKGKLEYMVCNDHQCLPPDEVEFSIAIK